MRKLIYVVSIILVPNISIREFFMWEGFNTRSDDL